MGYVSGALRSIRGRKTKRQFRKHVMLCAFAVFAFAGLSQQMGFGSIGQMMGATPKAVGSHGLVSTPGAHRALLSTGACPSSYPDWFEAGGWVLYVVAILYLFLGIAIICDDYFTPSLEVICEKLNLSEDVAGATFMAAGSSAPELFSSTMSLVSNNATNELGISTIVGSAVFNILIIIAATVLSVDAPFLQLDWKPVTRDCFFYAAAIIGVLFIFRDGKVWWWEGLISVCLYFVYVGFMHFNERIMTWVDKTFSGKVASVEMDGQGTEMAVKAGDAEKAEEGGEKKEGEEEEEDSDPFKMPDSAKEIPMWALSYPWYFTFWLTVPVCAEEENKHKYLRAFSMSVFWICAISYGMVDSAAVLGCLHDIPEVVMGTLVLAAGTSIPDALGSIAVAKGGQGDMAVANAVGSNVFDIWLGLGLPWLVFLPSQGGYEEVSTNQLWPSVLILFGVLCIYYFTIMFCGWKLTKMAGWFFLVCYAGFATYSIVAVWILDIYDLKKSDDVVVANVTAAANATRHLLMA